MAFFDKILGKKQETEKLEEKSLPDRQAGAKGRKKPAAIKTEKAAKVLKKEENIAHRILAEPFVTEKSTSLGQFNKYVFKVVQKAEKRQIKEAIQDYYGVRVASVHTIKIHPKKRIHGRTVGYKKGYKKAIVTLQQGDTIGINESV